MLLAAWNEKLTVAARNFAMAVLVTTIIATAIGCGGKKDDKAGVAHGDDPQQQSEKTAAIRLAHVNWAEGIAITSLAKVMIEDRFGVNVAVNTVQTEAPFASLREGQNDVFLGAWLPVTHQSYLDADDTHLQDLGAVYEGAQVGLLCPAYVQADSIPQLSEFTDRLHGRIIGINEGTEIVERTKQAIEIYDLDYTLETATVQAVSERLAEAVTANEWIVVTGWKPHPHFAQWDLKFLKDPETVYGETENLHAIARAGFEDDMPEISKLLRSLRLTDKQLGGLMLMIQEAEQPPADIAREWMNANPDFQQPDNSK